MKYRIGDFIIVEELDETTLKEDEGIVIDSKLFKGKEIKYYQKNLQGKVIHHDVLGDIYLGVKGRKETFFRSPKKYLAIICFIDEIIKTGYSNGLPEELEHERSNDSIYEFYRIYNVVTYDNTTVSVTVYIAQDNKGKKYYLFKASEINENFLSSEQEVISNPNKLQEVSTNIINQLNKNVKTFAELNTEIEKYIGENHD